jgi:hypothetical protein
LFQIDCELEGSDDNKTEFCIFFPRTRGAFNLVNKKLFLFPCSSDDALATGNRRRQCITGGRCAGEEEGGTAVRAPQGPHPSGHDLPRARRDGAHHGHHCRRPQSCAIATGLLE